MEHYCNNCKTTREFRLKQESNTESIYTCPYCGTEWKRKTLVGHAKDWGGVAAMIILGGIFGGGDGGGSSS